MSNYYSVEISGEVVLAEETETYMVESFLARHELSVSDVSIFRNCQGRLVLTYQFADNANYGKYEFLPKADAFLEDVERYLAGEPWFEDCHFDCEDGSSDDCWSQKLRGTRAMIVEKRLLAISFEIETLQKEWSQLQLELANLETGSTILPSDLASTER